MGQCCCFLGCGWSGSVYMLYAGEGSKFLFGSLTDPSGSWGFIFAFRVLPIVIFFGALISLLLYLGIIQFITKPISVLYIKYFGTSQPRLCVQLQIFSWQTEAPILIKHYLNRLTRSEMLTVMVAGNGTTSAPLFIVYATLELQKNNFKCDDNGYSGNNFNRKNFAS